MKNLKFFLANLFVALIGTAPIFASKPNENECIQRIDITEDVLEDNLGKSWKNLTYDGTHKLEYSRQLLRGATVLINNKYGPIKPNTSYEIVYDKHAYSRFPVTVSYDSNWFAPRKLARLLGNAPQELLRREVEFVCPGALEEAKGNETYRAIGYKNANDYISSVENVEICIISKQEAIRPKLLKAGGLKFDQQHASHNEGCTIQ